MTLADDVRAAIEFCAEPRFLADWLATIPPTIPAEVCRLGEAFKGFLEVLPADPNGLFNVDLSVCVDPLGEFLRCGEVEGTIAARHALVVSFLLVRNR